MKERVKKYRYSEIFGLTIQGEGQYTGIPTSWIRFFGCNFECQGFSQADPTDPSTWVKEYEDIDLSHISDMSEIPVLKYGCDSAYSWSKRFAHLVHQDTVEEICDKLENLNKNEHNPEGKFLHPKTNQYIHMAFTGGEPMMQQSAIEEIIMNLANRLNFPCYVTVETNGTQPLRDKLESRILTYYQHNGAEWFWSCSPKLSASGEPWEKAIQPEVVRDYNLASQAGQLKFVVDGTERVWDEVARAVDAYREVGVKWPVWIMPVGAADDQQENIQAAICEECFRRGYNFSPRVHAWIFGNCVGK